MKRAIGYIRISDKDQSNFSIEGQERYIRDFCERNKYELMELFIDDGRSAKNFDRPDWRKLEDFIDKNKGQTDYLVVVKYDRFSRNTAEGLHKIEFMEKKYNMYFLSVFEQMLIDHHSPFFFKQRADILVNAEFELRVIRDRTRFGIHEAKLKGRYISKAPFGYINDQDADKKPILIIDQQKVPIIEGIYQDYLNNVPLKEIASRAREKGYTIKGRSAIIRTLSNCTYAGLVQVPAYRDNQPSIVKALHPAIIDESTWMEVQYKLGNINQPRNILNDELPLRGVLRCECGKAFTGSKSKGKSKYYYYYKCNDHPKNNYSAIKLHDEVDELLSSLSLSSTHLEYLSEAAHSEMKEQLKERTSELKKAKAELVKVLNLQESLEQKFLSDQINQETYNKWNTNYSHTIHQMRSKVSNLESDNDDVWNTFKSEFHKLSDMKFLYHNATLLQKQLFIRLVFNSKLYYSNGSYRTPEILPIFVNNVLAINKKSLLVFDQEAVKQGENPLCTPSGNSGEHFARFMKLVAEIKAA